MCRIWTKFNSKLIVRFANCTILWLMALVNIVSQTENYLFVKIQILNIHRGRSNNDAKNWKKIQLNAISIFIRKLHIWKMRFFSNSTLVCCIARLIEIYGGKFYFLLEYQQCWWIKQFEWNLWKVTHQLRWSVWLFVIQKGR